MAAPPSPDTPQSAEDRARPAARRLKVAGLLILALYALLIMVTSLVDSWADPWLALILAPAIFAAIAAVAWNAPGCGTLLVLGGLLLSPLGFLGADTVAEAIVGGIVLFSPMIVSGLLLVGSALLERRR